MSHALLSACEAVMDCARHVHLNAEPLDALAEGAPAHLLETPDWLNVPGGGFEHLHDALTWFLTYNAMNFCYWPDAGQRRWFTSVNGELAGQDDEALGVMAALRHAIRSGVPLGDWRWLAGLDRAGLARILAPAPGAGPMPMLDERLAALHDLAGGRRMVDSPTALLEAAQGSAVRFVSLLTEASPSWSDVQVYNGISIPFHKRAWLCAAMIFGRFQSDPSLAFQDPEQIPVFSDYRLPQLFRGVGVLELSDALAEHIDAKRPLPADSHEEIELRAAAVVAAARLQERLAARLGHSPMHLQVDHFLWRTAVERDAQLPPFHRTRTTRY